MKLLALSDLHGEALVLDRLRVVANKGKYDYILIAGDITEKGLVFYVNELLGCAPNIFAIHGNMDTQEVVDELEKRGASIHGRKKEIGDWNLVGWGGSNPTPFNTPSEMSEEEIERGLDSVGVDKFTILVTHAPPYGYFDEVAGHHVGSRAIRKVIEKNVPLLNICGHIHENEGYKIFGETLIVKLPPALKLEAAEIDIGDEINVNFIEL